MIESPHMARSVTENVRDYNGVEKWSVSGVQERYRSYCLLLGVLQPRILAPIEHRNGDIVWIYPIMEDVIKGIEAGDPACIELGIDFIEEDAGFFFGRTLKANTARALRRAGLTDQQKTRIRQRVVHVLVAGKMAREFREYRKLLKKLGVGEFWPQLDSGINRNNPLLMRVYDDLRAADRSPET